MPSMDTLVTADPKFPLIVQSPPPIGPETVVEPLFIEFVCTGSGAGAGAGVPFPLDTERVTVIV